MHIFYLAKCDHNSGPKIVCSQDIEELSKKGGMEGLKKEIIAT